MAKEYLFAYIKYVWQLSGPLCSGRLRATFAGAFTVRCMSQVRTLGSSEQDEATMAVRVRDKKVTQVVPFEVTVAALVPEVIATSQNFRGGGPVWAQMIHRA